MPADTIRVRPRKTADAFRTISEVADELHVPQHVLRFWETKFPQVRPLKRGGGRRYYRPEDVVLLRRVADLLYTQGYTIKGVQRLLREGGGALLENIPPASAEEQREAAAERSVPPAEAAAAPRRQAMPPVTPQLPMPGLLPDLALAPVPPPGRPTAPRTQGLAHAPASSQADASRLRGLLTETLQALEELRRMIG
ncbi:MAG: MerR family transcriptional regulator [Acidocella sp.]|nr:MerR family transcriptional regulator [Acidocella sp.]